MTNLAAKYQSQAVQTAAGPQLLVMLFDRLAADIDIADQAIAGHDLAKANETLQHAQQIVKVLHHSLQPDGFTGGKELAAVYDFLVRHLVEANLHKDRKVVGECAQLVAPLRRAWHGAVANPRSA